MSFRMDVFICIQCMQIQVIGLAQKIADTTVPIVICACWFVGLLLKVASVLCMWWVIVHACVQRIMYMLTPCTHNMMGTHRCDGYHAWAMPDWTSWQGSSREISPTDAGFRFIHCGGQLVMSVEEWPTDGGPSQLTTYRLDRCWLLHWAGIHYNHQGYWKQCSHVVNTDFHTQPLRWGFEQDRTSTQTILSGHACCTGCLTSKQTVAWHCNLVSG